MIDLMKIEASEAERIAYSEGFTMAAELFARIARLEQHCADAAAALRKQDIDTALCILSEATP